MIRAFAMLLPLGLLFGDPAAPGAHTDPDNLVEFKVPDGWSPKDTSNGIRFGRTAAPGERTVLSVKASRRGPTSTLQATRTTALSQIKAQEFPLLTDKVQTVNGWDAWESVADASRGGSGPIMHSFHLFSKDIAVDVMLIAAKPDYPKYKADLLALVQSIREQSQK